MCEVRRFRRNAEIHGLDWLSNLDCESAGTFRRSSYQMRWGIEQSMPQIWMEWRKQGFLLPYALEAFVGRPPPLLFATLLGMLCGPVVFDLEACH